MEEEDEAEEEDDEGEDKQEDVEQEEGQEEEEEEEEAVAAVSDDEDADKEDAGSDKFGDVVAVAGAISDVVVVTAVDAVGSVSAAVRAPLSEALPFDGGGFRSV